MIMKEYFNWIFDTQPYSSSYSRDSFVFGENLVFGFFT